MGRKEKEQLEVNLLELVPERLVDHEKGNDGLITLLAPRFKSRIMKRFVRHKPEKQFIKIKLDELGSAAWHLCDGRKNIKDIGETLKENFGETIEPCYDRLGMFFAYLEHEKYIHYKNLDELRNEPSGIS